MSVDDLGPDPEDIHAAVVAELEWELAKAREYRSWAFRDLRSATPGTPAHQHFHDKHAMACKLVGDALTAIRRATGGRRSAASVLASRCPIPTQTNENATPSAFAGDDEVAFLKGTA